MTDQTVPNGDEKFRAAHALQEFARIFSGIAGISDKLLDVASLEKQASNAEQRIAAVRVGAADLKAAQLKATSLVVDAKAEADEILAGAKAAAQELLDTAHAQAREVQQKAQVIADQYADRARQEQHIANAAIGAHTNAMEDVQKAKDELARIEQMIASLKAKF